MSQFNVTTGTLRNKLQELQKDCKQLENKKQELEREEKALSAKWDGKAKAAFDANFQKDIQKIQQFITGIHEYEKALEKIIAAYEQAEAHNIATAAH
ncbi:WXG100 family type VII secretion target [Lachnospiraceae bacterium C10]|jgi:WXG100 family type VII secretion target|nr:WXG100 family type VII secretion target [Lachnospiraceae bacterium]SCW78882.1 WXG100 family type VII secretion target [Lachnospiraceae bacterium C10]SDW24646.1 WXG100 family type VII secretion target [Lachnospiraceae bacterium KHCPX20]